MMLVVRHLSLSYILSIIISHTWGLDAPLSSTSSSALENTLLVEGDKRNKNDLDKNEGVGIESVPMTEQVMDPDIRISDIPDVEASTDSMDPSQQNKIIRDIAYFLRAHKFQDYDRRYLKAAHEASSQLYEEFPRPPLRSLHWEVRSHCETGFLECLTYFERIIKLTALRREDDAVTVMKEQSWNLANNSQQILAAQRDCLLAQRRDNLTMPPFQGPIERFQWRTTASYYMCWYTMLGLPELKNFGEACDNHANCLLEYGPHNADPRADDTKPYACALYSFCPDHCCPMKHIWYMKDCFQFPENPCYAGSPPGHRKCSLRREENQDIMSLQANHINVSCECQESGYEWSSRFGLCIDINECSRGLHNCSADSGESCLNLPGSFLCICLLGYTYNYNQHHCLQDHTIEAALAWADPAENHTERKQPLLKMIEALLPSSGINVKPILSLLLISTAIHTTQYNFILPTSSY